MGRTQVIGTIAGFCVAVTSAPLTAQPDFYQKASELVVTRGQDVVTRLPCERIPLPRENGWPSHHVGGHVGRTRDGRLYAAVGADSAVMLFESSDDGKKWNGRDIPLSGLGGFAVLADDTFLAAMGDGQAIQIHRSIDRGKNWEAIASLPAKPFDGVSVDSNLLQLKDGAVLLAINGRMAAPKGAPLGDGIYAQYLYRSVDGGQTWDGGGDRHLWTALQEGKLSAEETDLFKRHGFATESRNGRLVAVDIGSEARWPGVGGTFPGCFETGFCELANGTILAAFRYSGFPRAWHKDVAQAWGANAEPDDHGRTFRHVFLGESMDGGKSWKNLRPVLDSEKRPFLESGECNGELIEMAAGRLVLVHQKRYPRNASELVARVSADSGKTWATERYRVNLGFGYSNSLVLEDGTIVTVTGSSDGGGGHPRGATVIRWRLAAR